MAKRAGMQVDEFGFGFPPRVIGKKIGDTIYSLNMIPLGGFVRIYGEDGKGTEDKKSFSGQGAWPKTKVIMAGVLMNVVLAFVLLSFANFAGMRTTLDAEMALSASDVKVQILGIAPGSPAENANLMLLDEITGLKAGKDEVAPKTTEDVQNFITSHKDTEIGFTLMRGGEVKEISVVSRETPPEGEGPVGIALDTTGIIRYPFFQSIWRALLMTKNLIIAVVMGLVEFFRLLFVETRLSKDVAGPVGIYFLTRQLVQLGLGTLLAFAAQISVALAVLNALPIVPLDGGRQLLILIEKIRGRALSMKVQNSMALAGWVLLLLLIIFVTKQDIRRFF